MIKSLCEVIQSHPHRFSVMIYREGYHHTSVKSQVILFIRTNKGDWIPFKSWHNKKLAEKLSVTQGKRFSEKAKRFY